jgi:hypothetical protein
MYRAGKSSEAGRPVANDRLCTDRTSINRYGCQRVGHDKIFRNWSCLVQGLAFSALLLRWPLGTDDIHCVRMIYKSHAALVRQVRYSNEANEITTLIGCGLQSQFGHAVVLAAHVQGNGVCASERHTQEKRKKNNTRRNRCMS